MGGSPHDLGRGGSSAGGASPCSVRSSPPRSRRLPAQRPAQHARAEPPVRPPTSTSTRAASRGAEAAAACAAAAVGFTRRSLTRGRARGDFFFPIKHFFSLLFFLFIFSLLFCKIDFSPLSTSRQSFPTSPGCSRRCTQVYFPARAEVLGFGRVASTSRYCCA